MWSEATRETAIAGAWARWFMTPWQVSAPWLLQTIDILLPYSCFNRVLIFNQRLQRAWRWRGVLPLLSSKINSFIFLLSLFQADFCDCLQFKVSFIPFFISHSAIPAVKFTLDKPNSHPPIEYRKVSTLGLLCWLLHLDKWELIQTLRDVNMPIGLCQWVHNLVPLSLQSAS